MKKFYHILIKALLVSMFALMPLIFFGQDKGSSFSPYLYFKGAVGTSFSHNDLNKNAFVPDFSNAGFGFDLGAGYQFHPIFGVNGKFFMGSFSGEKDRWNARYEGDAIDLTLNGTINFSNLFGGTKDRKFNVNGLIGFGQTHYQSTVYNLTTDALITNVDYATTGGGKGIGGRRIVMVVPYGFGLSYAVSDNIDINADWTMRWMNTENMEAIFSGAMAVKNDMYSFLGIGATFKLLGDGLNAMVKNYDGVLIEADPKMLEEKGEYADVTITASFPEKYFNKKVAIWFQPVLVYEGGQTELKPVTLKGEDVMGDGFLIEKDGGGVFTYTDKIKYSPEMNKSKLILNPIAYVASVGTIDNKSDILNSKKHANLGNRELADGIIYTSERIVNELNTELGPHWYKKEVVVSESANLYFDKNSYNLNLKKGLNKADATKAQSESFHKFMAKGWDVKSIDIDGYASPEGTLDLNTNLSDKRAVVGSKMMNKHIAQAIKDEKIVWDNVLKVEDINFVVNHHGPDWDGFIAAVEASTMADKKAMIHVIRKSTSKEQEISNMIVVYPSLEKDVLPALRRTTIAINCFEPKFTDEEIAEYAVSDPDKLKLNELFYAAEMASCCAKLPIYETIMQKYPKCWRGYNNAAIQHMKHAEWDKAKELLTKADELSPDNGQIINNFGVLCSYQGNYENAEKYYLRAKGLGINVNYNLAICEIEKGNYDKALALFGNKTCDYNAALAQFLNGKYSKAENNLTCVKSNKAEAAYLLAVIGARTNNATMLYENLTKAIELNEDYKAQAKTDREFMVFENTPEFIALFGE